MAVEAVHKAIDAFSEAQRALFEALVADGKTPEEAKAGVMRSVVIGGNYLKVEQAWLRERESRRSWR